ncbi:MAG: peptide chain release factor N(5)-glutamine methyltransferase [Clostridiales bacterium]|jgi:release factor-specific protein-(glutamine-N5) methyltransferase|nr:peptide chain release factor N(5)-glutamine methyltransferase [Clostridiales bacterium]
MKKTNKTRIGGQAVIEGVMMRGAASAATAVRCADGTIAVISERVTKSKSAERIGKIPLVRGVYNFVLSMIYGVKTLNKSAEPFMQDGTSGGTKTSDGDAKKKKGIDGLVTVVALVIGLAVAVGLFVILPQFIMQFIRFEINFGSGNDGIESFFTSFLKNLLAGIIRIVIFVAYLFLVSRLKDIKRVFMYHGAEHKVINCFEYARPLTVENVRAMTTKHERCGTTFIFIVMFVGVLFFSFFGFDDNMLPRIVTRIALLPVVAGLSYEALIFTAKHDNLFFRILRAPGMWLQRLTTSAPDDEMIEVSLAAFRSVLALESNPNFPVSRFEDTIYPYDYVRDAAREKMSGYDGDEYEWILAEVLGRKRSELALREYVTLIEYERILAFIKKRKTGMPLQRVFGYTEFYGYKINVDGRVLSPRQETEILTERTAARITEIWTERTERVKVLDLCTGSGAIAIALKKLFGDRVEVTATDIDNGALQAAKENAAANNIEIRFLKSDIFDDLTGEIFDVIVSNPPYIRTDKIDGLDREVKDFDPRIALDGGADGLRFYTAISEGFREHLTPSGVLLLEIGQGQDTDVKNLFQSAEFVKDYNGIKRVAEICLKD